MHFINNCRSCCLLVFHHSWQARWSIKFHCDIQKVFVIRWILQAEFWAFTAAHYRQLNQTHVPLCGSLAICPSLSPLSQVKYLLKCCNHVTKPRETFVPAHALLSLNPHKALPQRNRAVWRGRQSQPKATLGRAWSVHFVTAQSLLLESNKFRVIYRSM